MTRSGSWRHGLRMLAILALLGAAAFPLYWMFVTSLALIGILVGDGPDDVHESLILGPEQFQVVTIQARALSSDHPLSLLQ